MKVNAKGERLAKLHTGEKVLSREEADKIIKCSHAELYDGERLLCRFEGPFTLIRKDEVDTGSEAERGNEND